MRLRFAFARYAHIANATSHTRKRYLQLNAEDDKIKQS